MPGWSLLELLMRFCISQLRSSRTGKVRSALFLSCARACTRARRMATRKAPVKIRQRGIRFPSAFNTIYVVIQTQNERDLRMKKFRLELSRSQILAFRRRVGALDERLPPGEKSLRQAAWAGLQDSMPRAALLSIHARVQGTQPSVWEHSCLVQIWGPRFSNYVVAAKDLAVFSLGRLPDDARRRARAQDTAAKLHAFLAGRRMPFGVAGRAMGVVPNSLRYAAQTGTVLMRWDGARQPVVWTVPLREEADPLRWRLELARRFLHIFGPSTAMGFQRWAGITSAEARKAFAVLGEALTPVRTPIGDAFILSEDESAFRAKSKPSAAVRLLPSGDAYYLFWGAQRELLVPNAKLRAALWTTRVWPGALLVRGEIVGVWRRASEEVSIETWRRLSAAEREAVEAEATSLPLPVSDPITIRFEAGQVR